MEWSFKELSTYDEPLKVNIQLNIKNIMKERFPDLIIDITPVKVDGYLTLDNDDAILSAHVCGEVTVPSSRSLEPVVLPIDFEMNEIYINDEQHLNRYDEDETVIILDQPVIVLEDGVIDNIVAQIPIQVLTEEEKLNDDLPSGDGWNVISEDDYSSKSKKKIDPRLSKLKDILSDNDDK